MVKIHPKGKEDIELEGKLEWDKEKYPDAPAIIGCHGFLGSCNGTIKDYGEYLGENGYCFLGISLRGHGNSGGRKKFISSKTSLEDIGGAVDYLRELNREKIGICGLSVGGAAALLYITKKPKDIQAISLISVYTNADALNLNSKEREGLEKVCKGFELFKIDKKLEFKRNGQMIPISAYKSLRDELNVFNMVDRIPDIPLLMIMASGDNWISPKSMKKFFEELQISDKELKEYKDNTHELKSKRIYIKRYALRFFDRKLKEKKN